VNLQATYLVGVVERRHERRAQTERVTVAMEHGLTAGDVHAEVVVDAARGRTREDHEGRDGGDRNETESSH
jgi:hypothetical protein